MESELQGQSCGTDIQASSLAAGSQVVSRCSRVCCPRAPCTGFGELEVRSLLLWFPDPETSGSGAVVEVIGIRVGWGLHGTGTTGKTLCSSYPWCVLCMCMLCMCVVYVCVCVCVRVTKTVPEHEVQNLQPLHWARAVFQGLWAPQGQACSLLSCFFILSCDSPRSACPQLQITGKIRIIIGKYWIGELDAILYFDKTSLFLNNILRY